MEEVKKLVAEKRSKAVTEIFPQIVYALSDVLIYVSRDPPHSKVHKSNIIFPI